MFVRKKLLNVSEIVTQKTLYYKHLEMRKLKLNCKI